MRPSIRFEVVEWFEVDDKDEDDDMVLKVRLFGTDHNGDAIDVPVTFPEPLHVWEVAETLAKMNKGAFRPSD